jgi:hypothetical protein
VGVGGHGVLEFGQLHERDRQLEMGVDLARIARKRRLGVGGRPLEQALLVGIGAEIDGFDQGRSGGQGKPLALASERARAAAPAMSPCS